MAGFAVNVEILTDNISMPYQAGYEEDKFLVNLGLNIEDIEPLADNCTKVLVWHTRTYKYKKPSLMVNFKTLKDIPKLESLVDLLNEVMNQGMAAINPNSGTKPVLIFPEKNYEQLPN